MSTDNNMNAANVAKIEVEQDNLVKSFQFGKSATLHLVADDRLIKQIGDKLPSDIDVILFSELDQEKLIDSLANGSSMIWIGDPEKIPVDLWIGSFTPTDSELKITVSDNSPLNLSNHEINNTKVYSAYIKPVKEMGFHNINEEIRADFLPILDARDRFGEIIGYPSVLMNYHSPSLAGSRFYGSKCWFFLFDDPCMAMENQQWISIIDKIVANFRCGIQIKSVETDYSLYHPNDRIHIRVKVNNRKDKSSSVLIKYSLKTPNRSDFKELLTHRRCPDAYYESDAIADILAKGNDGLYIIRVDILQDLQHANELSIYGDPQLIESRYIGYVLINGELKTPELLNIDGPCINIDGRSSFWAGTHYYPSSSWWEWVWRDFRPLNADIDFGGIRRTGYRIVRIWIDPILDEQTLRAMDACIYLASMHGIILDICVFTQWVRTIGFERSDGEHVSFDFRHKRDFNVYSISLRNISLQKEYISILASRWKNARNIMYNLSNETYIMDPDSSQMDPSVSWDDLPVENSSYRNSCVFRKWSGIITSAIRSAGGDQPVLPGYMFSLSDGGDNYIGNRDADVVSWHCYLGSLTGLTLTYFDPICTNRPIILEEFGINGWNNEENYDDNVHYALSSGASAAMSYEWGIGWLAPEMCFTASPLREAISEKDPDPRWFAPAVDIGNTWPSNVVGMCATSSGFGYGSIYHGTPFPADAAIALGRLGLMGDDLGRAFIPESVYLLIPTACNKEMDKVFNVISSLWESKSVFGVWHEDSLESLPESTKVLIVPLYSESLSEKIKSISNDGIKVIDTFTDNWCDHPAIPKVLISPSENVNMQIRRTIAGTLYTLKTDACVGKIELITETNKRIIAGIDKYLLIHQNGDDIDMVEASGSVDIDGINFCDISKGRVIVKSVDHKNLIDTKTVKLLASEPCWITFNKNISSVKVSIDGSDKTSIDCANDVFLGATVNIDAEMAKYVIYVEFE